MNYFSSSGFFICTFLLCSIKSLLLFYLNICKFLFILIHCFLEFGSTLVNIVLLCLSKNLYSFICNRLSLRDNAILICIRIALTEYLIRFLLCLLVAIYNLFLKLFYSLFELFFFTLKKLSIILLFGISFLCHFGIITVLLALELFKLLLKILLRLFTLFYSLSGGFSMFLCFFGILSGIIYSLLFLCFSLCLCLFSRCFLSRILGFFAFLLLLGFPLSFFLCLLLGFFFRLLLSFLFRLLLSFLSFFPLCYLFWTLLINI